MSKTLEEMREVLGKAFDNATLNYNSITDYTGNSSAERVSLRSEALKALAARTDSVATIEAQIA
ncbi:MAG: hypothetical protein ACAH80_05330, partial [Alphaproteobacteria bacterium]